MRPGLASGEWGRVVGDLRTIARGKPFRVALAISVLLHVTLFVVVRWDPAGFAGSRGVRMFRLHLIEEAPEPVAPIAAVEAGLPAAEPPAGTPATAQAQADHRPARDSLGAAAETTADVAMTAPAAESSSPAETASATEALADEPSAAPPTPVAPGEGSASIAADAPPAAGALGSLQAPAQNGSPTAISAAPAAVQGGATSVEEARGTGPDAGNPGNSIAGGIPGAPDVVAVRRRIDARKLYPRVAVRNGWEGRVLVEMRVDGEGSLKAVRVVEGSGHPVLDEATIASVRRASPFPPVAGTITIPVEYRLIP